MDSGDANRSSENDNFDEKDAFGQKAGFPQNNVAKMSVPRNATHYKMDHPNRGIAIIFNHESFTVADLKSRSGTKKDCYDLADCLKQLKFDVRVYNDLEYRDMDKVIGEAAGLDHTDNDCFVMCVMSHGDAGILYARDTPYKPENLWLQFAADKCPSLASKPKLFFIQACQGNNFDRGVTLMSRTETDGQPALSYKIPACADFLISYSTIPGFFSWRNTTRGSWYIQALCDELKENQYKYDLLTLLTFVSQRVAIDYESNVPDNYNMHRQKQIPCISSMLIRMVQFSPK